MPAALTFALTLSALHIATLLATHATFAWMFRRGIAARFQVDGGKAPRPDMFARCVREVALGQIAFAVVCGVALYPLWYARGGRVEVIWAPVGQVVLHLALFAVLNETIFYASHRALHLPWLYRRIHARHHRFVHVRAPVAEYAQSSRTRWASSHSSSGLCSWARCSPRCASGSCCGFETAEAHSGYAPTRARAARVLTAAITAEGAILQPLRALGYYSTDRSWRRMARAHRRDRLRAEERDDDRGWRRPPSSRRVDVSEECFEHAGVRSRSRTPAPPRSGPACSLPSLLDEDDLAGAGCLARLGDRSP
jgi:hypothetical protein